VSVVELTVAAFTSMYTATTHLGEGTSSSPVFFPKALDSPPIDSDLSLELPGTSDSGRYRRTSWFNVVNLTPGGAEREDKSGIRSDAVSAGMDVEGV
jgi:hypothetical protein